MTSFCHRDVSDLDTIAQVVSVISGIATVGVVFLLWKTVRDMQETTKLNKVQLQHRFRPWVGPSTGVELMKTVDNKNQYVIAVKNYGEIPASNVTAESRVSNEMPDRDMANKSDGMARFNMGPLLPAMEKRYWFFVESDLIKGTQVSENGHDPVYVVLHFKYEFPGGASGYGMISQYDPKSNAFVHKEMWIE